MPSRPDRYDPLLSVVDYLRLVHTAGDVEAILQATIETACAATDSTRGLAGLCDGACVTSAGWYDIDDGWTACNLGWELGEGGPGRVCRSGKPFVCNELPPTAEGLTEATELLALTSFASVPIIDEAGTVLGCLEVGNAPESYSPDDVRCLTALAAHAALRLHAITGGERRDLVEREKREEMAKRLERLLAPSAPPQVHGVEIGALCRWNSGDDGIGGDFFDYFHLTEGQLGVGVGDVSGKGIEAVVWTVVARYALRAVVETQRWPAWPGDTLREMQNALRDKLDEDRFVTLVFAMLNVKTGDFSFATAGHPAPFVLRPSGVEQPLALTSPALGVQDMSEIDAYPTERVELKPGDAVLLFTDGIAEMRDPAGRFYEETRMVAALEELKGLAPQELVDRLLVDAQRFASGRPPATAEPFAGALPPFETRDDIALVCLRLSGD
jgi:serine phosphatase RsbU (regulator of sigma subunit)